MKMDDNKFNEIRNALRESARMYPFCRIASCDCDGRDDEWKKGCFCMCHFSLMDKKFGEKKWSLSDHYASAEVGRPIIIKRKKNEKAKKEKN